MRCADDIVLISHTVTVMQKMLDLCDVFAADLVVRFNTTKSVATRIGPNMMLFVQSLCIHKNSQNVCM